MTRVRFEFTANISKAYLRIIKAKESGVIALLKPNWITLFIKESSLTYNHAIDTLISTWINIQNN